MSVPTPHAEEREQSEFGAGVVVCLAKFSEHLTNRHYERIQHTAWWAGLTEDARQRQRDEAARFPTGDAAQRLMDVTMSERVYGSLAHAVSDQIEMWMNGASDHFYDLNENRAPAPLKELASLALRIGHGFTGEKWTMEHVERIRVLWRESCLAVDSMLAVDADWGRW